jgi:SAM-dependent methyltransferase
MLDWNEQTIEWYSRAVGASSFYSCLARQVRPYLNENDSLFDIGCGLGFLSTGLAPFVKKVTAVDINENAIDALLRRCLEKGISNVEAVCADWNAWRPEKRCQVLVMSFFSGLLDNLEKLINLTERYLISILHWEQHSHSFNIAPYLDSQPRKCWESVESVEPELKQRGIPFMLKMVEGEFGQPFTTLEDAINFIKYHYKIRDEALISRYLERHLTVSSEGYYLPNRKKSGIFFIDVNDLLK